MEQWYERLNEYFPGHEMKDPKQLRDLINEKDIYHKEETEDYIVLYADFPAFIFIDYLLVSPVTRGKGVGTKLLERFKEKGKMILLEAEPRDAGNEDACKRLAFYKKNGFKQADQIVYEREDEQGEPFRMHILYWSPIRQPQEDIMNKMILACREIHNFRAKRYYGKLLADPDDVLRWKSN